MYRSLPLFCLIGPFAFLFPEKDASLERFTSHDALGKWKFIFLEEKFGSGVEREMTRWIVKNATSSSAYPVPESILPALMYWKKNGRALQRFDESIRSRSVSLSTKGGRKKFERLALRAGLSLEREVVVITQKERDLAFSDFFLNRDQYLAKNKST